MVFLFQVYVTDTCVIIVCIDFFFFFDYRKKSWGLLPTPSSMSLADYERVGVAVLPSDGLDCNRGSSLVCVSVPELAVFAVLVAKD